jgi:hypothetical protein
MQFDTTRSNILAQWSRAAELLSRIRWVLRIFSSRIPESCRAPTPSPNYGFLITSGHHRGCLIRRLICFSCSDLSQAKAARSRVPVLANLIQNRKALETTDPVRNLEEERDRE